MKIRFLLWIFCLTAAIQSVAAEPVTTHVGDGEIFHAQDHVAIVGNAFADLLHLDGYVETLLRHRLAEQQLVFRNFGWAGDTLGDRARPANFASEDQWLAEFETDVILVCFGMGESFAGEPGLESFAAELRKLLGHYRLQTYNGISAPTLVLISPIAQEALSRPAANVSERNRMLAKYTSVMAEAARDLHISFVNLFEPTQALMNESGGSRLTSNGIHLTPYGYWVVSLMIAEQLAPGEGPVRIVLDADHSDVRASGCNVSLLRGQAADWSWNMDAHAWPSPAPPEGSQVHRSLERYLDQLVVKGLPPGEYQLSVASETPIMATAEQLAAGISVSASPRHAALEEYRNAVNQKNLLHFHGWRALNQVHIVGERKQSPSGRALPGELLEWQRRTAEEDERLTNISSPSQNEPWQLIFKR